MMAFSRSYIFAIIAVSPVIWKNFVSGSSSEAPLGYTSVRALDKYGHSEQLQNAQKAANLQGTLVVVARDTSKNSTLVLSLLDPCKNSGRIYREPCMIQLINNNAAFVTAGSGSGTIRTALVCTGLKGDANWLVQKVRRYSHRVWERYNTFLDAPGAAFAVSKFSRKFWGYDEESEWQPGLLLADQQGRSQEERIIQSWGRPLGIVTIILSSSVPYVFVVEPSGVVQRYTAFAMGKRSEDVMEKLAKTMNEVGGSNELEVDMKDRLVSLLHEIVGPRRSDMEILVEELSETGVDRTLIRMT